jgi:hypothetical protein
MEPSGILRIVYTYETRLVEKYKVAIRDPSRRRGLHFFLKRIDVVYRKLNCLLPLTTTLWPCRKI